MTEPVQRRAGAARVLLIGLGVYIAGLAVMFGMYFAGVPSQVMSSASAVFGVLTLTLVVAGVVYLYRRIRTKNPAGR